jgi:hypothetical protein
MGNVQNDRADKIGDLLFRYMRARHRFKGNVDHPIAAHELAALISEGKTEFDEVYIEPHANPPIVFDGKADDVFDAIIKKRYRAIPFFDPQLVAAWRHYVISDGPMPGRPEPSRCSEVEPLEPPILLAMSDQHFGLDIENARCAWVNSSERNSNSMHRAAKSQLD